MSKLSMLIIYHPLNVFIAVWELMTTRELFYRANTENKQGYV